MNGPALILAQPASGSIREALLDCYSLLMPVDAALLEILVCPACKAPVHPVNDGAGLKCASCRRVYPVRDDIPVMLVDEATIED
jgi:uncharacterized protein YbaR (Trm112 family)